MQILNGIYAGAHDGPHKNAEKSDCGAIGRYEDIVASAVKYQVEIKKSVQAMFSGLGRQCDGFDAILLT